MPSIEADRATKKELRLLRFRLVRTRAGLVGTRISAGAATAASLVIGVLAAEMTLDWLVHLPWLARACISLPTLAGGGWILYREVLRPLLRMPSDHAVACEIERALPVFETRLIASIQLARVRSALVAALIRETAALAAKADFREVVKTEAMVRALRMLFCVLVAAGGLAWMGWGNDILLLERALLLTTRLPSRTQIEKMVYPSKIAQGEDLKIDVYAGGVLPESGMIEAQSGSRTSQYKLERVPGTAQYHAVIHSVPASLTLLARLNDTESDTVAVTVLAPPAVLGVRCTEVFPAYTKLPPAPRPTGDLSLLAGSVLKLEVTASGPVELGSAHLAGLNTDLPLGVDPANPRLAHGDIPIPKDGLTGFSLRLVDENGIASRETAVYQIDIVPDRPPTIKLTHPGAEDVATAGATEVIAFHAEDDFGVATVLLHYVVNHAPEKVIEFDLTGETPRALDRSFEWKLGALKLAPGGTVEYWLEAIDGNNVTGPGRGATDHAQIKIVTEEEKRAELAGRMNDALGSLDEVSQSEDDLAKELGKQIFQKP